MKKIMSIAITTYFLNLFDMWATYKYVVIEKNAIELNPYVNWLLNDHAYFFFIHKILLVPFFLGVILYIYNKKNIEWTKYALHILFVVYAMLVLYQVMMIFLKNFGG